MVMPLRRNCLSRLNLCCASRILCWWFQADLSHYEDGETAKEWIQKQQKW